MQHNTRSPTRSETTRRFGRRPAADAPAVPTFEPDPSTATPRVALQAPTDDDPANEAVRRMVEAAYT